MTAHHKFANRSGAQALGRNGVTQCHGVTVYRLDNPDGGPLLHLVPRTSKGYAARCWIEIPAADWPAVVAAVNAETGKPAEPPPAPADGRHILVLTTTQLVDLQNLLATVEVNPSDPRLPARATHLSEVVDMAASPLHDYVSDAARLALAEYDSNGPTAYAYRMGAAMTALREALAKCARAFPPPPADVSHMLHVPAFRLTPETLARLAAGKPNGDAGSDLPMVVPHPHGWFLWADTDPANVEAMPADVAAVVRDAHANGCAWVDIQADDC